MSAQILREAAALMRSRAEAATFTYAPPHPRAGQEVPWFDAADGYSFDETDGPHIIGWSPTVALAVADWLDITASWELIDCLCGDDFVGPSADAAKAALAVARAYLGATS